MPGLGQVSVGRKRIGWALVLASLASVLAAIGLVVATGATEVAAWLVDPDVLLMILVANLVIFGVRVWSTATAWWAAGGRLLGVGLAAMLLFVALPHLIIGYVALESRSALEEIFVTDVAAAPVTTTTTSVATTSSTVGNAAPVVPANPILTSSSTTTTTLPLGTERLTMLLLGGDAGPIEPACGPTR